MLLLYDELLLQLLKQLLFLRVEATLEQTVQPPSQTQAVQTSSRNTQTTDDTHCNETQ